VNSRSESQRLRQGSPIRWVASYVEFMGYTQPWYSVRGVEAPVGGHGSPICWYWRSDADGVATWGPTSRSVPQWTRPGATLVETLGRHGHHH
jgi:hypothetical protein